MEGEGGGWREEGGRGKGEKEGKGGERVVVLVMLNVQHTADLLRLAL